MSRKSRNQGQSGETTADAIRATALPSRKHSLSRACQWTLIAMTVAVTLAWGTGWVIEAALFGSLFPLGFGWIRYMCQFAPREALHPQLLVNGLIGTGASVEAVLSPFQHASGSIDFTLLLLGAGLAVLAGSVFVRNALSGWRGIGGTGGNPAMRQRQDSSSLKAARRTARRWPDGVIVGEIRRPGLMLDWFMRVSRLRLLLPPKMMRADPQSHVLYVGGPGAGKTQVMVTNALLTLSKVVAFDPQGAFFDRIAEPRRAMGRKIILLDAARPELSAVVNVLGLAPAEGESRENYLESIASTACARVAGGTNEFYYTDAQRLVKLVSGAVLLGWHRDDGQTRASGSLRDVRKLIGNRTKLLELLERLSKPDVPVGLQTSAQGFYEDLKRGIAAFQNVLQFANQALAFIDEDTARLVVGEPFSATTSIVTADDLADPRVDVVVQGRIDTFQRNPKPVALLLNAMWSAFAHREKWRSDGQRALFLVDELGLMGALPMLETELPAVRQRGLTAALIVQSLRQLDQALPKHGAKAALAYCGTKVFLSVGDRETAEEVSSLMGDYEHAEVTITTDGGVTSRATKPVREPWVSTAGVMDLLQDPVFGGADEAIVKIERSERRQLRLRIGTVKYLYRPRLLAKLPEAEWPRTYTPHCLIRWLRVRQAAVGSRA